MCLQQLRPIAQDMFDATNHARRRHATVTVGGVAPSQCRGVVTDWSLGLSGGAYARGPASRPFLCRDDGRNRY
jgi:hypothetical protein